MRKTPFLASLAVAVLVDGSLPADAGSLNRIRGIEATEAAGNTTVRVAGTATPTFTVYKLERPERVVVDVAGAELDGRLAGDGESKAAVDVNSWAVSQVTATARRGGGHKLVRVVVSLARSSSYRVEARGSDLVVEVAAREPRPEAASDPAELAAARHEAARARAASRLAAERARQAEARARRQAAAARAEIAAAQKKAAASAAAGDSASAARLAEKKKRERAEARLADALSKIEKAKKRAVAAEGRVAAAGRRAAAAEKAAEARIAEAARQAAAAEKAAEARVAAAAREAEAARAEARRAGAEAASRLAAAEERREAAKKRFARAESLLAAAEKARVAAARETRAAAARERAAREAIARAETRRRAAESAETAAAAARERADEAKASGSQRAARLLGQAESAARAADRRRRQAEEAALVAEQRRREALAAEKAARERQNRTKVELAAAERRRDEADKARAGAEKARAAAERQSKELAVAIAAAKALAAEAASRAESFRRAASEAEAQAAEARARRVAEEEAQKKAARGRAVAERERARAEAAAGEVARSLAALQKAEATARSRRAAARAAAAAADRSSASGRAAAKKQADARARELAAAEKVLGDRKRELAASEKKAADLGRARRQAAGELAALRRAAAEARAAREREERRAATLDRAKGEADSLLEKAQARLAAAEKARAAAERSERAAEAARARAVSEREKAEADRAGLIAARRRAEEAAKKAEADRAAAARDAARERDEARAAAAAAVARAERAAAAKLARARKQAAAERARLEREARAELAAAREQAAAEKARAEKQAAARIAAAREQAAAEKARAAKLARKRQATKTVPARPRTKVRDVRFVERDGGGRVVIGLSAPARPKVVKNRGKSAVLEIEGASVAADLERTLDTSAFAGPVKAISSYRDPKRPGTVRVVVDLDRPVQGVLKKVGNNYYWDFDGGSKAGRTARAPALQRPRAASFAGGSASTSITQQTVAQSRPRRRVYRGRRIDLNFKDADIHNLLRILSTVGGVNIVIPQTVRGTVTVRLKSVPWDQAMEVILASQGLWYKRSGSLIRVDKRETLEKEDKDAAERAAAAVQAEAPEPETFTLNYSDAQDIRGQLGGLLSPKGRIEVDKRTNTLIINDIAAHRRRIIDLATRLDTQTPQIQIEARVVEARTTFAREFGIQWGGNVAATPQGGNATGLIFPSSVEVAGAAEDGATPNAGVASVPSDFAVNLPAAIGTGSGGGIGISLGSVGGNFNINLRLSALEDTGTVRIISAPKITTSNNINAKIKSGVSIPVSQVSANGVQTTFINADLSLEVIPAVSQRDCSVSMRIKVKKNEADFANTGARGDPSILTKEADTTILVSDGETAVVGGIYTRNTGLNYSKVPFFAEIPVIGYFFKNRSENDERSETLIFITPKITNRASLRCE